MTPSSLGLAHGDTVGVHVDDEGFEMQVGRLAIGLIKEELGVQIQ